MMLTDIERRLSNLEKRLDNIERNNGTMVRLLRAILVELELRKEITQLDKDLEARNGSDAPPPVGG